MKLPNILTRTYWFLSLFFISLSGYYSQSLISEPQDKEVYGNDVLNGTLVPQSLLTLNCASSNCGEFKGAELYVRFGIGSYQYEGVSFVGDVTIRVTGDYCRPFVPGLDYDETFTLHIDQDKPLQVITSDISADFKRLDNIQLQVISYSAPQGYENEVKVELQLYRDIERGATLSTPIASSVTTINPSTRQFSWVTKCSPSEDYEFLGYEFQLLRLYNTEESKLFANDITTNIDWSTATTIQTYSRLTYLDLTISEGTGYYIWRVRGIGNEQPGGQANPLNWTKWSGTGSYVDGLTNQTVNGVVGNYMFFYNQFDEDKNWIHNRIFAEGEASYDSPVKIKEGMTYANKLSQVKQSQTRINSDGTIIAGQTLNDYSGRSGLQSMPVPVTGKVGFSFENNLLNNTSGTEYSVADFDSDGTFNAPTRADLSSSNSYSYYSDNGTADANVPSAAKPGVTASDEGYPFSRTLYYADGLSRVQEQSGVGYEHSLEGGKTNKVLYASVADDELLRVFGHEAPNGISVHKIFSTDENNVTSISYIGKAGEVLATCLVYSGENGTDDAGALDGLSTQDIALFEVQEEVNPAQEFPNGEYIERKKDLPLFVETTLDISYSITPSFMEVSCLNYCKTCDYHGEVYILDKSDNTKINSIYFDIIPDTTCANGALATYTLSAVLPVGNYEIVERLYYNNEDILAANGLTYLQNQVTEIEDEFIDAFYGVGGSLTDYMNYLGAGDIADFYAALEADLGLDYSTFNNGNPIESGDLISLPVDGPNGVCVTIEIPYKSCDEALYCPDLTANPSIYEDYYETEVVGSSTGTTTFNHITMVPSPILNPTTVITGVIGIDIDAMVANMVADGYDCGALWNCWTFLVDNQPDLLSAAQQSGQPFDIIKEFLNCTGYDFQNADNTQFSTKPYGYFAYVPGDLTYEACEDGFLGGSTPSSSNTEQELFDFYTCISSLTIGTAQDLTDIQTGVTSSCEEFCDLKAASFESALIYEYRENGYVIEGDQYVYVINTTSGSPVYVPNLTQPAPANFDISLSEIECQVNAMVASCKEGCVLTPQLDGAGNIVGYGSAAEQALIQQMLTSEFAITLPDGSGNCNAESSLIDPANYQMISGVPTTNGNIGVLRDAIYGTDLNEALFDMIPTSDGGYLLGGAVDLTNGDYFIVKTNSTGTETWRKRINTKGEDYLSKIVEHANGYYLVGTSNSLPNGDKTSPERGGFDYWVVDINTSGAVMDDFTFGGTNDDILYDAELSGNNLILVGMSESGISGTKSTANHGRFDAWVVAVNMLTNTVSWEKSFGGTEDDALLDATVLSSGNIAYGGVTNSSTNTLGGRSDSSIGGQDAWALATTPSGAIVWEQVTGGTDKDIFSAVLEQSNGTLLLAGKSQSAVSGEKTSVNNGVIDYYLVALNSTTGNATAGNPTIPLWDKSYGSSVRDEAQGLIFGAITFYRSSQVTITETTSGELILAESARVNLGSATPTRTDGGITSGIGGNSDYWVVGIDAQGTYIWDEAIGGNNMDNFGGRVIQTASGSLILAGTSDSDNGFNKTDDNYGTSTDFWVVEIGNSTGCVASPICFQWTGPITPTVLVDPELGVLLSCEELIQADLIEDIQSQIGAHITIAVSQYRADYRTNCIDTDNIDDLFALEYNLSYHHYTLFYHDRVGRVIKTVPPAGVDLLDVDQTPVTSSDKAMATTSFDRSVVPRHRFVTDYQYNSLGQMVRQHTPDGGETKLYYDDISRLRFSQNAKQIVEGTYSYMKYDNLGRMVGAGQSTEDITGMAFLNNVNTLDYPSDVNQKVHVTNTIYTIPASGVTYQGEAQQYLRNRVSYVIKDDNPTITGDESYIYYSYDPHGNVKWIVEDLNGLDRKTVAYEYDLISGNVLQVSFNAGGVDQFFHRYDYDADNRILSAQTSSDGVLWDEDGAYEYYKHGPLKKTTIGEDKVQGYDYTYTLQGWLKGINHSSADLTNDPSQDGINNTIGQDVFGMTLNYYDGDFTKAGSSFNNNSAGSGTGDGLLLAAANANNGANTDNLYNGNISAWAWRQTGITNLPGQYDGQTVGYQYRYDELNRIKGAKFSHNDGTNWTATEDYKASYSFDGSGNLRNLNRNSYGNRLTREMDRFSYKYADATTSGQYNASEIDLPENIYARNQLNYVTDGIAAANWDVDIDDQGAFGTASNFNYQYDGIGQLVKDQSEGIDLIEWTPFHKVEKITKTSGDVISFKYDAMGHRILKKIEHPTDVNQNSDLHYICDASGNVMANYKTTYQGTDFNNYTASVSLIENPIYGSDRIGLRTEEILVQQYEVVNGVVVSEEDFDGSYILSENENQVIGLGGIAFSTLNPQGLPLSGQYEVNAANYTNSQNYQHIGTPGSNQAIYEDQNGTVKLKTSTTRLGVNVGFLHIEDGQGNLVQNQIGITAHHRGRTVIFQPNSDEEIYMIITQDQQGRLFYSTVDMTAGSGGLPTVVEKNIAIDGSFKYARAMAMVEDHTGNEHKLFVSRNLNGTNGSEFGYFNIGTNVNSSNTNPSISLLQVKDTDTKKYIKGDIQISPNGKEVATVLAARNVINIPFFNINISIPSMEGSTYELDPTYDVVANTEENFSNLFTTTSSADYTKSGLYLYYSAEFSNVNGEVRRYNTMTNVESLILPNQKKSIRRQYDESFVTANSIQGPFQLQAIGSPDLLTPLQGTLTMPTPVLSNTKLRTHFGIQNHRIYQDPENLYTRCVGQKFYEIKDHLGNVRTVITDRKYLDDLIAGNYTADISSYSDYYPYGMVMPGRNGQADNSDYRYGFNGMEKDDEVKGKGNSYNFGARIYDNRLGRWLSVDKMSGRAPGITPYRYGFNNPIRFYDPDGNYERDGHYWTVLLMGTLMKNPNAEKLAYWAEYPDHIMNEDGTIKAHNRTWLRPEYQIKWHALTGGDAELKRKETFVEYRAAKTVKTKGLKLHTLGDSFAHSKTDGSGKLYVHPYGHMWEGTAPDKVGNRPALYKDYVQTLAAAMDETGTNKDVDLFIFIYIYGKGYETQQNADIMSAEYNLLNNNKTFRIATATKENLKQYFIDRGVQYNENYKVSYSVDTDNANITNVTVDEVVTLPEKK